MAAESASIRFTSFASYFSGPASSSTGLPAAEAPSLVPRAIDKDVAGAAKERHGGRLIRQYRWIGLQPGSIKVDALRLRAKSLRQPRGERARARIVRTIEEITADGRIGPIQRTLDRGAFRHA